MRRFGRGEEAADASPGDILLTHRRAPVPWLIRLAQSRRFRGRDRQFAHWSHAALVVADDGTLVEAETRGVRLSPLARYRDVEYHLVRSSQAGLDNDAAVAYARAQVGDAFGFLVLVALGVWLATGVRVSWSRRDHQICSGLVARALTEAGEHFEEDPTFLLPADLAEHFGVSPTVR